MTKSAIAAAIVFSAFLIGGAVLAFRAAAPSASNAPIPAACRIDVPTCSSTQTPSNSP